MVKKKVFTLFLVSLLGISLFFSLVKGTVRTIDFFNLSLPVGDSLGFQDASQQYVLITVANGTLNSSVGRTRLYVGSGYFRFTSNNTCTLELTWNVTNVKASGDSGNVFRVLNNGANLIILPLNDVFIQWDIVGSNIWFPIEFIFGMVGLCSMFGSSIMGVYMINKGEYVDGLKFTVVWFAFGIALTVAWLWA